MQHVNMQNYEISKCSETFKLEKAFYSKGKLTNHIPYGRSKRSQSGIDLKPQEEPNKSHDRSARIYGFAYQNGMIPFPVHAICMVRFFRYFYINRINDEP